MANSYQPTYWIDKSTPAINSTNLRKIEKGIADAHGIADTTIGSTGTVDRLVIIDGAGHYLQVPSLTTTQRDALTAANGMIIYNITLSCFQARRDGAWVDLHAGAIREDLNLNGKRIQNLGAPTSDADAATKQYVDLRPASSAIVANAYLSGSSWYRTDPAKPAWRVEVDANADLCRYLRAPAGSGAIAWTDVYQVGPGGLRPRICVASNEIRHESLATASAKIASGDYYRATLKTYRIPAGAPYYGAGHYQMSVRVTAKIALSYTYAPKDTGVVDFWLQVDGGTQKTARLTNNETQDVSWDVQVNPSSTIQIGATYVSMGSYTYATASVSDFRIRATDTFAEPQGW